MPALEEIVVPVVDAAHKVQQYTYQREQGYGEQPGHLGAGIAVVEDDDGGHSQEKQAEEYVEYYVGNH